MVHVALNSSKQIHAVTLCEWFQAGQIAAVTAVADQYILCMITTLPTLIIAFFLGSVGQTISMSFYCLILEGRVNAPIN